MIKYQRITLLEREEVSRHLASGYSLRVIAASLRRAPSSISREIRQAGFVERKYYRAIYALISIQIRRAISGVRTESLITTSHCGFSCLSI